MAFATGASTAEGDRRLREMFESGVGPCVITDATFMAGRWHRPAGDNPNADRYYRNIAHQEQVDVTGRVYFSSLAQYPGDPRAWIDSRSDVKRLCEERGWDCDGRVQARGIRNDIEPKPSVDIADDILEEEVTRIMEETPEPIKESRRDLKEKVREKRRGSIHKTKASAK